MSKLTPAPGQTVGPFFGYALPFAKDNELATPGSPASIRPHGPATAGTGCGGPTRFAPKLPPPLWQSVYDYGWSAGGPLFRELGLPNETRKVTTIVRSQTRGRDQEWELRPRESSR